MADLMQRVGPPVTAGTIQFARASRIYGLHKPTNEHPASSMKRHIYFILALSWLMPGCSSEQVESPTTNSTASSANPSDNAPKKTEAEFSVDPEPIFALSQVGNINNTPEFIRAQKIEQQFKNGKPQRELTIHFYRKGPNRFHGPYKEWYPSGGVWKEGAYEENNRVDDWKWYAENGTLVKQAAYNKAGNPNGTWIYYNDDGIRRRIENFSDGKRDGETEYYSEDGGQLLEKFSFKNDQLDGVVIRWFPLQEDQEEPQKRNESHYVAGKRNGVAIEWYEDGQMRSEVEFKDGDRHGHTSRWDADGNLELELLFEDGEPVDPSATPSDDDVKAPTSSEAETEDQKGTTPLQTSNEVE